MKPHMNKVNYQPRQGLVLLRLVTTATISIASYNYHDTHETIRKEHSAEYNASNEIQGYSLKIEIAPQLSSSNSYLKRNDSRINLSIPYL